MKYQATRSLQALWITGLTTALLAGCGGGGAGAAGGAQHFSQLEGIEAADLRISDDHVDDSCAVPAADVGNQGSSSKVEGQPANTECYEKDFGKLTFDAHGNDKKVSCDPGYYRFSQRYTGTSDPCNWDDKEWNSAVLKCKKPSKDGTHDANHVYVTCCRHVAPPAPPKATPKPTPTPTATPTCYEEDFGKLTFDHDGKEKLLSCGNGYSRNSQRYTGTDDPCSWKDLKTGSVVLKCVKPGKDGTHDVNHAYIKCCKDTTSTPNPSSTPSATPSASPSPSVTPSPTSSSSPSPSPTVEPSPEPSATATPDPTSSPVTGCTEGNRACFDQTVSQPLGADIKSVDLLFVTDTSASLDAERGMIADNIDKFVAQLPADVNYRIAVMLGHGSKSAWSGKLFSYGSTPRVLDSTIMSPAEIRSNLRQNLTRVPSDTYAGGGEEMLYSLQKALDATIAHYGTENLFFRTDATLVTVFITDENDICYTGSNKDGASYEIPAYNRDCNGLVTAKTVYDRLAQLEGNKSFVVSGIVHTSNVGLPKGGEDEMGLGIIDLVKLGKGTLVDLINDPIADGLKSIGIKTTKTVSLQKQFTLHHENIDPNSVFVTVDGVRVPFQLNGNVVTIADADAGAPGSDVTIHYCLKCVVVTTPSPSPSAEPSVIPSATPSVTPSPEPSAEPSPSPTSEPSVVPSPEPSVAPSTTPSPSPTVTVTPSPSPTVTASPTPSPSVTVTPSPSPTVSASPSPAPSATPSASPSPDPTVTPSPSPSPSPTPSECVDITCDGGWIGN
jgi:hypothetical protein